MRRGQNRRLAAFTLVELLVVIAIITVLVSLLLPAIQKTRQAAWRVSCANNMKQLALACLNYESAYKSFPIGNARSYWATPQAASATTGVVIGNLQSPIPAAVVWRAQILPYIEENNIAAQYNYQADWCDSSNNNAIYMQIRTFNCPATPNQPRWDTTAMEDPTQDKGVTGQPGSLAPGDSGFTNPNAPGAVTDYFGTEGVDASVPVRFPTYFTAATVAAANVAVGDAINEDFDVPALFGVLERGRLGPTRLADITDGTSHTIVIQESAGRPIWYGANQAIMGMKNEGRWADPNGEGKVKGCSPLTSKSDKTDVTGIMSMNCENYNEPYSFHPGGCNFAFADGSVQFLNVNLPVPVLAQLVTKAGGENVNYEW